MSQRRIKLILPYPPTINHYYGKDGRTGHQFILPRGREYRKSVVMMLRAAGVPCMEGPLAIRVDVWFPDRRKRDKDNLKKALYDALQHAGVCEDDNQFKVEHTAPRGIDRENKGRVEVYIDGLPADPLDDDTLWTWIAGIGLCVAKSETLTGE